MSLCTLFVFYNQSRRCPDNSCPLRFDDIDRADHGPLHLLTLQLHGPWLTLLAVSLVSFIDVKDKAVLKRSKTLGASRNSF